MSSLKEFAELCDCKKAEGRRQRQKASAAFQEIHAHVFAERRRRSTEKNVKTELCTLLVRTTKQHGVSPSQFIDRQQTCALANLDNVTEIPFFLLSVIIGGLFARAALHV